MTHIIYYHIIPNAMLIILKVPVELFFYFKLLLICFSCGLIATEVYFASLLLL